jgi:hypothetical protein
VTLRFYCPAEFPDDALRNEDVPLTYTEESVAALKLINNKN